jgi:hypothetical protein
MTDNFVVTVRGKSDQAEIVPSFANGVVNHDEGAAWCHRVAGEIEWAPVDPVICGDGMLIRVRSHHVERKFCLWYEFVPKVDGERRVRASEDCDEVPLECLYGAFSFV